MSEQKTKFERAGEDRKLSLFREFYVFVKENKAWWMIPILLVLSVVGLIVALGSTGIAPFIYTLF